MNKKTFEFIVQLCKDATTLIIANLKKISREKTEILSIKVFGKKVVGVKANQLLLLLVIKHFLI